MSHRSIILIALVVACTAGAAHAQHGRPQVPFDPAQRGPNAWVKRLIDAINEGTGVEKWKEKDAMRLRVEIDFDPPKVKAEDDGGAGEDASDDAGVGKQNLTSIRGRITYDLRERIMRFDFDGGIAFIASGKEIAIWSRDAQAEALSRDDVPDAALAVVRDLYHLVILPLWINDPEGFFTPGGLRHMFDEPYYASARIFREPPEEPEEDDANKGDDEAERPPARQRYPEDWYVFFSDTYQPHRIDAAAILMHDRSRPLKEFPLPRVFFFDDFEEVDGVAIARTWRIHQFSRVQGPGERVGSAKVTSVEFVERDEGVFDAPERALRVR